MKRAPITREKLSHLADEDLMVLVERADPGAFESFYDRHGGAAFSLAYRIVGDRGAAEDVTQEAFLSLWRCHVRYDAARGSVRSWVLGVVRNRSIDRLRSQARRAPILDQDPQDILEQHPSADLTDEQAVRRETARRLQEQLIGLPPDQHRVIHLSYFGGFSHSEIAEMLNLPMGTVKGRMRLALDKIRGQLAEGI